ncbi:unnamed protein product [Paramecium octaurelia]|uniref:NADH dehydrogenase [ubiquinone] 1 alpha subcomplex subunit 8 n=1 Tax=Paramecium octaurelia TaxID=43137 RepID=A0A8S1TAC4_PAROT|nr:unnamed protein product [Paramecium octaurelia]
MNTKSFEVLIHSQFAFHKCRSEVHQYEDCRQTTQPIPKDPRLCKEKARELVGCYKEAERMHPLCLAPFNDVRECVFKADGNIFNCKKEAQQFVDCQMDQEKYQDFLSLSTDKQKEALQFDFFNYRGHFDKYS